MADTSSVPLGPILVTGGCGFIGSHLVQHLQTNETDSEVHVVDISTERNRIPGVTYYDCDVSSLPAIQAIFDKVRPKTVFHLASPDALNQLASDFQKVNVGGTRNMLAAAQAVGVQAFVNTSSSSMLHDNCTSLNDADESFPILEYPQQQNCYSLAKVAAHKEVMAANRGYGKDELGGMLTASVLPVAVFGPWDNHVTRIASNAKSGRGNIQMGPGTNVYDYTYIDNHIHGQMLVARGLIHAYGKPRPLDANKRVDGEYFLFTDCQHFRFWDFSRAVAAEVGYPVDPKNIRVIPVWLAFVIAAISEVVVMITSLGKRTPNITRYVVQLAMIDKTFSCEKAKRVLGYEPLVTTAQGLAITGEWLQQTDEYRVKGTESAKNK